MRRERVPGAMSRWQPWRWVLHDVLGHDTAPESAAAAPAPQCLKQDADEQLWLHTGFAVSLHRDDVQGYYLNATSPAPCWFVLWRMQEPDSTNGQADATVEPMAVPVMVSLSYHDAGRWLDAQEQVDQVPAPADIVAWMGTFVQQHWEVEPKRRQRPESFRSLQDRFGNPASVSTGKARGTGAGRHPDG